MPKLKMTDAAVSKTTANPGERIDFFDAHPAARQRGLVLRVTGSKDAGGGPRVSRTWAVLCRVRGSTKLRRFTIGDYPGTSLAEARKQAGKIVTEARWDGADPLRERKEEARKAEIAGKDTVKAVVEAYLADLAQRPKKKGGMRAPRYIEETRRNFTNHVLPRWGTQNIHDIKKRDVGDLLEAVKSEGSKIKSEDGRRRTVPGGGIAANRTLAAVRAMFNYAARRGIIETSPATSVEPVGEEKARERALTDDEIRAVWIATGEMGYPFGAFFQLSLLLGQRRNETAGMRWGDLDLDKKIWTLPAETTKSAREHVMPLPPLAVDILKALPQKAYSVNRSVRPSPFVFTTDGVRAISGFSKAKPALDRVIARARDGEALPPWTIHDLRRTAATKMAQLGATEFVVGRVLNHAAAGVTGKHYNQYDYIAEKRTALEAWAKHVDCLVNPRPPADVTDLREVRTLRSQRETVR